MENEKTATGKKTEAVKITRRDLDILGWVGSVGAADTRTVATLLAQSGPYDTITMSRARALVSRWEQEGLIARPRPISGAPGFVVLTPKGAELVHQTPLNDQDLTDIDVLESLTQLAKTRLYLEQNDLSNAWVPTAKLPKSPRPEAVFDQDGKSTALYLLAGFVSFEQSTAANIRTKLVGLISHYDQVVCVIDKSVLPSFTAATEKLTEAQSAKIVLKNVADLVPVYKVTGR